MLKEQIRIAKQFINGEASYRDGFAVFFNLSSNQNLIRYLSRGDDKFRHEQLIYELSKLIGDHLFDEDESDQVPINNQPEQIISKSTKRHKYVEQTTEIQNSVHTAILEERKKMYRQRGILHTEMYNAINDEERYAFADQLMKTQSKIDKINEDLVKITSGTIPDKYLKQDRSADEFQRINNLKSYLIKYKKWLAEAKTVEERNKWQKKIEQRDSELNKLING